jgi:hypothetical protein
MANEREKPSGQPTERPAPPDPREERWPMPQGGAGYDLKSGNLPDPRWRAGG